MSNYKFSKETFVLNNFDKHKPFSSFLPGIAGAKGIPIWSFYTNRGQGITSFGVENKNNPIMEFFPANTSYQYVNTYGFRSFVKINGVVYEPFSLALQDENIKRNMYVDFSQFKIEEINEEIGIKYCVTYFVIPKEDFGGLARFVEIENIGKEDLEIEVIDGQAKILPYGVTNTSYKEMSNLMRGWMDVYNLENKLPFFTFRASSEDTSEVQEIKKGNFYLSFDGDENILTPIIDTDVVFGFDTSLLKPINFINKNIDELLKMEQVKVNKVPSAFSTAKVKLKINDKYEINTIVGQSDDLQSLNKKYKNYVNKNYLKNKRNETKEIIENILNDVTTETDSEIFNSYVKQCYLDNLLRGGYPVEMGNDKNKIIHYLYARKHGDPERDYNFFNISPEFYSQGNGNFRDVNQNRRCDVLINPKVKDMNLKLFYNLIQLDGYNPLEVKGYTYKIDENKSKELILKYFKKDELIQQALQENLQENFTPGSISKTLHKNGVDEKTSNNFFNDVLSNSIQNIEAKFGEGYWVDHFTYNQDLLENYLLIYPDEEKKLLFDDFSYKFYESNEIVLPRKDKYVLTENGVVRQYGSAIYDKERVEKLKLDADTNWLKKDFGTGVDYTTNLFNKMLTLALTKFVNLDPSGVGIEMEANKPGWNDAMNGLPGLIGSSTSETIELKRIVDYLIEVLKKYKLEQFLILEEINSLLIGILNQLKLKENDFCNWSNLNDLKEDYREKIKLGIPCNEVKQTNETLLCVLTLMQEKLEKAISSACGLGNGIPITFLYHEVTDYEINKFSNGEPYITHYGNVSVTPKKFNLVTLPYYLESPARYLKIEKDINKLDEMYNKIKQTDIYDKTLGMYKTCESIEQLSNEVGRIRAFTSGWQERESVFLHMNYKYMLGLLKANMYEKFFEEIKSNYVCFRDAEQYGRNPIENSSFIVPSSNPDKNLLGQGMVARLSGSTAEMLHMWSTMMVGKRWFEYEDDKLSFTLSPVLPNWLFKEKEISFKLFGSTKVVYINENCKNTYDGLKVYKYIVDSEEFLGEQLVGDVVYKIRNKEVKEIKAYLK